MVVPLEELAAQDEDARISVRAQLRVRDEEAQLCQALEDSDPPACTGIRFPIQRWERAEVDFREASGGVRLTVEPVLLVGRFDGRVFVHE